MLFWVPAYAGKTNLLLSLLGYMRGNSPRGTKGATNLAGGRGPQLRSHFFGEEAQAVFGGLPGHGA